MTWPAVGVALAGAGTKAGYVNDVIDLVREISGPWKVVAALAVVCAGVYGATSSSLARKVLALLMAGVVAAVFFLAVWSPDEGGKRLVGFAQGCLTNLNLPYAATGGLLMFGCDSARAGQSWELTASGQLTQQGRCLTAPKVSGDAIRGAPVYMARCIPGNSFQRWRFLEQGQLVNEGILAQAGEVALLDVRGPSREAGTPVQLWVAAPGPALQQQMWQLIEA